MWSLKLDKVDIYTWEKQKDSNNITSKTPILKFKDVECTLSQKAVSNLTNDPITMSQNRYTLFIPIGIEVNAGDKLVVTTRNLEFRAQTSFVYPLLKKKEIEVEIWAK